MNRSVCVYCAQAGVSAPQIAQEPTIYQPPTFISTAPQKTDVCAILAVVIGALGFAFLACVFGPAALILSAVSLYRIKEHPELKGRELAAAGLALGLFATAYSAYVINQSVQQIQAVTQPGTALAPTKLKLVSHAESQGGVYGNITGVIENPTDKTFTTAMVTFRLLDAEGNQVGTATDITSSLAPRSKWSYSASILDARATRYEFAGITAY